MYFLLLNMPQNAHMNMNFDLNLDAFLHLDGLLYVVFPARLCVELYSGLIRFWTDPYPLGAVPAKFCRMQTLKTCAPKMYFASPKPLNLATGLSSE